MLASPASTQRRTHIRALPSPISGRTEGALAGEADELFECDPDPDPESERERERGADDGGLDGISAEGFVTGGIDGVGG